MKMCKYDFTKAGVTEMYNDTLQMIFAALAEENNEFSIQELDIKIAIGDRETFVPISADSFEALFAFLKEALDE